MKRRIAAVVGTVLLSCLGAAVPIAPASAHNAICAAQGTATVDTGLYYPLFGPPANGHASVNIAIGACSDGRIGGIPGFANLIVTGLNVLGGGYCGHSYGIKGNVDGHGFGYVSAGSMLLISHVADPGITARSTGVDVSGTAAGLVNAIPDATSNQSCVYGAQRFLVTGFVAMWTAGAPTTPA